MKIFGMSKKQLKKLLEVAEEENAHLNWINEQYKKINEQYKKMNEKALDKMSELKTTIRKNNGAKGGLVAENNKLRKQNAELKQKLEESMSDKYRVKKIPSGRRPKGEPMRIKSNAVQSRIVKKVYEDAKD